MTTPEPLPVDSLELAPCVDTGELGESAHLVQFYDDDAFLLDEVAKFLSGGLEAGGASVVLAAKPHLDGIEERLTARGLDIVAARAEGRYVPLDAVETLGMFMADGWPDDQRFTEVVGGAIAAAARGGRSPVRAFGEMVAALWADGNGKGAIRLEQLWNQLRRRHSFSLLCAYPMRAFGSVHGTPFHEICAEHSRIIPTESYAQLPTADARLHMIAHLQQRASTLESARNELGQVLIREQAARAAADAGQEAMRRLAAIVEGSDDAIVSKTLEGIITSWNRGAERMFGYTAEEAVGQSITLIIPADRRGEETEVLRHLRRGEAIDHFETVRLRKDGQQIDISLSVSPVKNDLGQIVGASKIARDISDRKQLERERAHFLAREQHARAEAEAASRGKDDFLATLSHELRTPLNSILGWTRMLRVGNLDQPTSARAITVIEQSTHNLSHLVTDLLDVSRIVTGKMTLNLVSVDLVHVVGNAIDSLRPVADARRITVQPVLDHTVSPLLGDPDRLQQVLWNLLSNAVKFTPKGGRVELRLEALADGASITVADTGKGIAPDFLPHVFERFRQADSGSTRAQAGLGLGLAIVRHVVELHGGTVRAESAGVGHGATFIVHLPYHAPTGIPAFRSPVADSPAVPTNALRGLRVLIVDDNPDTCELLSAILVQEGAEVSAATSATDALALIEKSAPDILVSDIAMPGTDGYELIRRVRSRSGDGLADVPAVALTAYARPEDRERAIAAGFDGHISKPAQPEEFVRFLAQMAEKRSAARP